MTTQAQTTKFEPSLEQAERFIEALTGDKITPVTFQYFQDYKDAESKSSPSILHGTIHQHFKALKYYNSEKKKCGIYICVNTTDLQGRKKENITDLRALFIDVDGCKPLPQSPIPFSIVVQSAHGPHGYFLLEPGEDKTKFEHAQKHLAEYFHSDIAVSDISRVMRVPGFANWKDGTPFFVELMHVNDAKLYTITEILDACFIDKSQKAKENKTTNKRVHDTINEYICKMSQALVGERHNILKKYTVRMTQYCNANLIGLKEKNNVILNGVDISNKLFPQDLITEKEVSSMITWAEHHVLDEMTKANETYKYKPKNSLPTCNEIAERILEKHHFMRDNSLAIYEYDGKYWKETSINRIRSLAFEADGGDNTAVRRRNEITDYILCHPRVHKSEIPWNNFSSVEVPIESGILNLITGTIRKHKPENYNDKVLNIEYHPEAGCRLWEQCLRMWFQNDECIQEKIDVLQEFFGYILLNHARYKMGLLLYGPTDTGKSVPLGVMREMVGIKNCCQIRINEMEDSKKLASIKGKILNVLTELPQEALMSDGGFKQLVSTEEPIQLDGKWKQIETYVPKCKHVIATNNLPAINDYTRATYRRLALIGFYQEICIEEQDPLLLDKLIMEMQGIFNWAVEGAKRLTANNGIFTRIQESIDTLENHRIEQNPVEMFLKENYRRVNNKDRKILFSDFRDKFNNWIESQYPWSPPKISKRLRAIGIDTKRSNGKVFILGIATNEDYIKEQEERGRMQRRDDINMNDVKKVFSLDKETIN